MLDIFYYFSNLRKKEKVYTNAYLRIRRTTEALYEYKPKDQSQKAHVNQGIEEGERQLRLVGRALSDVQINKALSKITWPDAAPYIVLGAFSTMLLAFGLRH